MFVLGDVISFNLGNTPVIGKRCRAMIRSWLAAHLDTVLGTFKAASDLLGKRGGVYSSRPRSIVA